MPLHKLLPLSVGEICDLLLITITILCNIITEVTGCHFCHIVLVRSNSYFIKASKGESVSKTDGKGFEGGAGRREKARYRISVDLSIDARWPPPQPRCSSAAMHGPDLDVWCSPPTCSPPEALYRPLYLETRPLCDPRTSLSAHAQKWHLGGPVSGLG